MRAIVVGRAKGRRGGRDNDFVTLTDVGKQLHLSRRMGGVGGYFVAFLLGTLVGAGELLKRHRLAATRFIFRHGRRRWASTARCPSWCCSCYVSFPRSPHRRTNADDVLEQPDRRRRSWPAWARPAIGPCQADDVAGDVALGRTDRRTGSGVHPARAFSDRVRRGSLLEVAPATGHALDHTSALATASTSASVDKIFLPLVPAFTIAETQVDEDASGRRIRRADRGHCPRAA